MGTVSGSSAVTQDLGGGVGGQWERSQGSLLREGEGRQPTGLHSFSRGCLGVHLRGILKS